MILPLLSSLGEKDWLVRGKVRSVIKVGLLRSGHSVAAEHQQGEGLHDK